MIYDSLLWNEDLDETIGEIPEIVELEGKTVLITGAAGLICSSIVDLLIRYNETHTGKIGILAAGRDHERIKGRFGTFASRDYLQIVCYDALEPENIRNVDCDYIINGAGNAYPEKISKQPVETLLANIRGQYALLELARIKKVRKVLYISSSEVYGKNENPNAHKENDYGTIDPLNSRNSYSEGKRAAENLCASYYDEYKVESVIVRPGHIYGPTATESDNRVSSSWAYAAARGENIIMKSDGSSVRSYCYCMDCASAVIKVLLRGQNGKAYNISNPSSIISIREMAQILAEAGDISIIKEVPNNSEEKSFNPMDNSALDSSLLLQIGWKGLFDARRGLDHTVRILKDSFH